MSFLMAVYWKAKSEFDQFDLKTLHLFEPIIFVIVRMNLFHIIYKMLLLSL